MKKFFVIAAMMVAAVSANAQFEPGTFSIQPKLGGVGSMLSNTPNLRLGDNVKLDKTAVGGVLIGAEAEYQLTNMFSLAAGANYSMQGSAWEDENIYIEGLKYEIKDTKIELGYINVPVVVNAYLFRGFAVKTGVQFGFLTSAKMKSTVSGKNDSMTQSINYDEDFKDDCKKFDVSIPVGVSYQFKVPIVIDARYNIGLSNVYKDSDLKCKNQVFQITVGYKFKL
jgi:hypothetical protein